MREKKEKKRIGLLVFIIIIMVGTSFSVFLYGGAPQSEVVKYNGIRFKGDGSIWKAKINGHEAAFTFLPEEAKPISMPEDAGSRLEGRFEIDTTSDANSSFKEAIALAQHQMGLTLSAYNSYLRNGFTANNSFNMPIISCQKATQAVPVVYFRHGNSTNIHLEKDCIVAEASSNSEFIRVKDRLVYGMLGVIK